MAVKPRLGPPRAAAAFEARCRARQSRHSCDPRRAPVCLHWA